MTIYPYQGRAEVAGACPSCMYKGRDTLNELPAHLCDHFGARYLAQGYLNGGLTVSWYLHLLPQHLPRFVQVEACCSSQPCPLQPELPLTFFYHPSSLDMLKNQFNLK